MKKNKPKFGLQIPPEDPKAWILGGGNIPWEVLQQDGKWQKFLPNPEMQNKRGIETYDCTGFAILEAIETYERRKFGKVINYSDRWLGIIAGTGERRGNDPHTVCEAIRKYGLIPEEMLPFSDDLENYEEYYSFKGAEKTACYEAGLKWLKENDFMHEWVYNPTQPDDEKNNNAKISLKYCPIPCSVFAWVTDERGIYVGIGAQNHLTLMESYPDKTFFTADSYEPTRKEVEQIPLFAKRIYITKKTETKPKKRWWFVQIIINLFKGI